MSRRGKRRAARPGQRLPDRTPPVEVTVSHVGGRGDGIGEAEIGPRTHPQRRTLFIPGALLGERVLAQPVHVTGEGATCRLSEIIEPSAERIEPPCPHFGACGGCALQQWKQDAYRDWKRARVADALSRAGLDAALLGPLVPASPGTRRRAEFVMRALRDGAVIGFHERGSNRIVDLSDCPVLEPDLLSLAHRLRDAAGRLLAPGEAARATVNRLDGGLDLLLTLPDEPSREALEAVADLAEGADLCRVSAATTDTPTLTPLLDRRAAVITFAGIEVTPPPGAFLQATGDGGRAILDAVLAGVADIGDGGEIEGSILDLYAGCGALSLALRTVAKVHAVEGDPAASDALSRAVARAQIGHRVTVETRDLADLPLAGEEVSEAAAVVFDPPRAGARAQAEALAAHGPARVVAVSCNPSTFARDARILVEAGYRLRSAVAIDQFLWSPHVELVASFHRETPP